MTKRRNLRGRREMASIYLLPEAMDALRGLAESRDVPVAQCLREAVDDFLRKHRAWNSVDALMPPVRAARPRRAK